MALPDDNDDAWRLPHDCSLAASLVQLETRIAGGWSAVGG